MKVGDRVQEIYEGKEKGTVIRIGDWDDNFNPYKIMVLIDGDKKGSNFREDHLIVIWS